MAWAKIHNLIIVDNEVAETTERFSIPAGGSNPNNVGNCNVDIIFYKEDIEHLLAQDQAAGIRLVNTFLNTPTLGINNPLPLTFAVAYRENSNDFTTLNSLDNAVTITCPPVYIRNEILDNPQPGSELLKDQIRNVITNRY